MGSRACRASSSLKSSTHGGVCTVVSADAGCLAAIVRPLTVQHRGLQEGRGVGWSQTCSVLRTGSLEPKINGRLEDAMPYTAGVCKLVQSEAVPEGSPNYSQQTRNSKSLEGRMLGRFQVG